MISILEKQVYGDDNASQITTTYLAGTATIDVANDLNILAAQNSTSTTISESSDNVVSSGQTDIVDNKTTSVASVFTIGD